MSEPKIAHDQEHPGQYAVHAHISPVGFYVLILGVLMALTLITVGVSYIHLGKLNLIVAVVIASIKASLVVLFFMHLKYDNKFNAMILVVSLLFIGVFFAYTLNDTDHRGELDATQGTKVLPSTGEVAPGGMAVAHAEEHAAAPAGEHAAAPAGATSGAPAAASGTAPAPGAPGAPAAASGAPAGSASGHAPEPGPAPHH